MRGAVPQQDIYELRDFLAAIVRLRKNGLHPAVDKLVPADAIEKLARLATSSDNELFEVGIKWAILLAKANAITFAQPVYRGQFDGRLKRLAQTVENLIGQIDDFLLPDNSVTFFASKALVRAYSIFEPEERDISEEDKPLRDLRSDLSFVHSQISFARRFAPLAPPELLSNRGRPKGPTRSGIAATKFLAHLEIVAAAAGGRWTLNKNAEKGTLIDALEQLRSFLPEDFLPPKKKYPYSTYQNILARVRAAWKGPDFQKAIRNRGFS